MRSLLDRRILRRLRVLMVVCALTTLMAVAYFTCNYTPLPFVNRTDFNMSAGGTVVFIHIQKTSGSHFLDVLTTNAVNGEKLCTAVDRKVKRARCPRPGAPNGTETWLVSERTLGWICGVHSTYQEMRACLPPRLDSEWGPRSARRLHYMTLLRHPVLRYLSEYLHVRRGAVWSRRQKCAGKEVSDKEVPPCYQGFYEGSRWSNVTIQAFASCDSNWANNRQTMALVDLDKFGCFNRSAWKQREAELIANAKFNLRNMAFFGIAEYQAETTALFKQTFNIDINGTLKQKQFAALRSYDMLSESRKTSKALYRTVAGINHLDMQLYEYAVQLFASRLKPFSMHIDVSMDKNIRTLFPS